MAVGSYHSKRSHTVSSAGFEFILPNFTYKQKRQLANTYLHELNLAESRLLPGILPMCRQRQIRFFGSSALVELLQIFFFKSPVICTCIVSLSNHSLVITEITRYLPIVCCA